MARISSIKPEFFTSAAMVRQPVSARLTFIGLWTYVDDNGVGLDNERLVLAAVWPLDEDVIATLQRTREDLWSIARAGHIKRYRSGSGAFLYITSWGEHQKVSHPRKPRYPHPSEPGVTCVNIDTPETLASHSGGMPEPLRPEQGAGSREQGAGNTTAEVVTTSVEGTGPAAQNGDFNYFAAQPHGHPPLPPERLGEEAERRRQMDALMRMAREEAAP